MPFVPRVARGIMGAFVISFVVACSGEPSDWLQTSGFNQVQASPRENDWVPSSAGAYLVGRFALDQGDISTAANQLEQALRADPENPELLRQIFRLRLAGGTYDQQGARSLIAIDPTAEEARLLLALASAKSGDFAASRRQLDQLNSPVGAVIVPVLTAWTLYGDGQHSAARQQLEGLQRDDGFATLRAYHLAVISALDGDPAKAKSLLDPLIAGQGPAPVRLVATDAAVTAALGDKAAARDMLTRQNDFFDGNPLLDQVGKAIEADSKPPLPIKDAPTGMADALLSVAAALQEQGLNGQAILYARLATYLDPDAGDAWLVVARSFSAEGNPLEAANVLDQVPAGSPYKWNARLARAEALAQLKRYDEAAAELRAMSTERPDRVEALVALGDMLRGQEKYADAEKAYTEALARVPGPRRGDWRILYSRGITYERTNRWPQAEADFRRALELEPDQPYVLNYLGYSWVDKGIHLDEAKAMLHKAVEVRPEDGFIVDSLGWAYFRLGEYGQAVDYLEKAVELQPGDATVNDHLGDAYWRVGRQREARFQWKRALSFKPEESAVADIQKKLENGLQASRPDRG